jgi:hypothetical protein
VNGEAFKNAVMNGGAAMKWEVVPAADGKSLRATYRVQNKHAVMVDIVPGPESFAVKYADSVNMPLHRPERRARHPPELQQVGRPARRLDPRGAEEVLTARRVAVTGLGIVSCLGNERRSVVAALRSGASGVGFCEEYRRAGMRSQVAGLPQLASEPPVERRLRRFMGEVSLYAYHAFRKAVEDARLTERQLASPRTGLIVGTGVGSLARYVEALDALRAGGMKKLSPYVVPQTMASTAAACLATATASAA